MKEIKHQHWSFINYLYANPYDKVDGRALSKDEFYRDPKYFVEIPSWHEYKEDLDVFFTNIGHKMIRPVFISGFKGTGKTTFINWYINNSEALSKYTKLILNMDNCIPSYPSHVPKYGHTIFQTYLRDILLCFLSEDFERFRGFLFQYLYPKNGILRTCFSNGELDNVQPNYMNFFNELHNLSKTILNADGKTFNTAIGERDQENSIQNYLLGLHYTDLFLLFLLLYDYDQTSKTFFHKTLGGGAPFMEQRAETPAGCQRLSNASFLILVFDNIDHIGIESSNADFPARLEDVYRDFRTAVSRLRGADAELSIHFIFSIRDTNRKLCNLQSNGPPPKEIEFIPEEIDKIIERRIEIAKKECLNVKEEHVAFFKTLFNDRTGRGLFLALFNFNIRTLADNLDELQQNAMYAKKIKELYDQRLTYSDYVNGARGGYVNEAKDGYVNEARGGYVNEAKGDSVNEAKGGYINEAGGCVNGARGIYYFLLIRRLLKYDFLKEGLFIDGGDELVAGGGHVNPTRIILTDLYNMSKYTMDSYTLKIQNNNPQGLYDLYKTYSSLFDSAKYVDQFFDILAKLFLFHKNNWCHLITFTDKQVFNEDVFDNEKKQLKDYIKNGREVPSSFKEELNRIKVQLNPAGFMYLGKIIVHYEFYSARTNTRPLFCAFKIRRTGSGEQSFEFLENIDHTWKEVETCLDSLLRFMETTLGENFEETDHCYAKHKGNDCVERRLMIVRIIHTHLRYLDNFREHLLIGDFCKKFNVSKKTINEELIERQERYIKKLEELCKIRDDIPRNRALLNGFQKNMEKIKTGDQTIYIPLLNEREYERDYPDYEKDI